MSAIWDKIHAERADLADFVEGLSDTQLETPSLCGGWSVRDVVGHVISAGNMSVGGFLGGRTGAGFNSDKYAQKGADRCHGGTAADRAGKPRATPKPTKPPP